MLKIQRQNKIEVDIDGTIYSIRKPTQGDQEALEERIEAADGKMHAKIMNEYIAGLGLPIEVVRGLEQESFLEVCREIGGSKKNSPTSN